MSFSDFSLFYKVFSKFKLIKINFLNIGIVKVLVLFLTFFSFISFSHDELHEKEIEVALKVFEKAILLSPDLLTHVQDNSVVPFYKVGKNKIYLNQGFWNLTKAWVRIYIEEIEKHCSCDLDADLMVQEAKNYLPKSFLRQKFLEPGKHMGKEISYQGAYLTANYGYVAAGLKLSAEVAETILSVFMGIKGAHIFCNAIDVMIFPLTRKFQKYTRVFSYGRQMDASGSLVLFKTAWLSRQIKKSRKRVFFHIDQALIFRKEELEKVNKTGPKSLFHRKGHRLLWIEKLKRNTDPFFKKIKYLEEKLQQQTDSKERQSIIKQISKSQNKIENLSKVNRKDFFGAKFKRYLLLKSRKSRIGYMAGKGMPDKIIDKNLLWPLSLQENVIERMLISKSQTEVSQVHPDIIRDGLIEEFLSKKINLENNDKLDDKKEAIQFFLKDIEVIFNTSLPTKERVASVYVLEMTLGALFTKYLKMSSLILSQKHQMSFTEKLKLQWAFGRFFHLVYNFSDFLLSVAVIKDKTKIQFYKYESMEKLLAFFTYLHEVQTFLKSNDLNKEFLFKKLNSQKYHIQTMSLSKEKKTVFSFLPFKTKIPECKKIVEKYQ